MVHTLDPPDETVELELAKERHPTARVTDEQPAAPPRRRRRAPTRPGELPAAKVLVVMVATLCLAALVNADAMVQRAEHKPLGADRDRSLAIWHVVASASHALQVSRIRDMADALAGDDGPGRAPAGTTATTVEDGPAVKPTLRTPTPDHKLGMLIVGDSVARDFGESLVAAADKTGLIAPSLDYRIATGFTRPDYFDWPAELARLVAGTPPDVVVALFGANDAQGLLLPDGTAVQTLDDPRWSVEYGKRIGAAMDALRAPGRLVLWVGQPLMRDGRYSADMERLDAIFQEQAATRPWVEFIDSRPVLSDSNGRYADHLPDASGTLVDVRQPDGIHLSRDGADRIAAVVLAKLGQEARITGL
jgi:hypothetical protein